MFTDKIFGAVWLASADVLHEAISHATFLCGAVLSACVQIAVSVSLRMFVGMCMVCVCLCVWFLMIQFRFGSWRQISLASSVLVFVLCHHWLFSFGELFNQRPILQWHDSLVFTFCWLINIGLFTSSFNSVWWQNRNFARSGAGLSCEDSTLQLCLILCTWITSGRLTSLLNIITVNLCHVCRWHILHHSPQPFSLPGTYATSILIATKQKGAHLLITINSPVNDAVSVLQWQCTWWQRSRCDLHRFCSLVCTMDFCYLTQCKPVVYPARFSLWPRVKYHCIFWRIYQSDRGHSIPWQLSDPFYMLLCVYIFVLVFVLPYCLSIKTSIIAEWMQKIC